MPTRYATAIALAAVVLAAVLLRTQVVVGFGLGDDSYYAYTSSEILKHGLERWTPDFGSNYRFGLWIPIAFFFKLLGITDLSFVLFSLVGSTLLVVVVFLLGRELAGERVAICAALVQAVSAFDITFATTMTIDIAVSCLLCSSLLLLVKSEKAKLWVNLLLNLASAALIIWAYFIKIPALSFMLVCGVVTLLRREFFWKHLSMFAFFGILLGSTFALDYWLHGDPLNYVHNELKFAPKPGLFKDLYRLYPEWMFTGRNWLAQPFFGPHFYLGALAMVYCVLSSVARRRALPFLVWLAAMFLFLEFFPAGWEPPYRVMPRFFRYAHTFVPPVSLISGVFLASLWEAPKSLRVAAVTGTGAGPVLSRLSRAGCGMLILVYGYVSITQGLRLAALYAEYYADSRTAAVELASLPRRPVYADNNMHDKFNFYTGYERQADARWEIEGLNIQREIVQAENLEPLRRLKDGYVIFGGSRGVDHAASEILLRGSFEPPPGWKLIFELDRPLGMFRQEPLRIYEVSEAQSSREIGNR